MNRNVKLTLLQVCLVGVADSIWVGTVLAAYIYMMERDPASKNTWVGVIEAAYGMSTLVSAFPVGYIADKYGRAPLIATGGALSICAAVVTAWVVWVAAEEDEAGRGAPRWAMLALAGCMVAWGISGGIVSGPAQALYADSIPHGERSKWYTYLFATYLVASAVGPAVAVVLFHVYGNGWTLRELRTVMLVGLGMEVVAAVPSFFLRDKHALGAENDVDHDDDGDGGAGGDANGGHSVNNNNVASGGGLGETSDETTGLLSRQPSSPKRRCIRRKHIPYVMFACSLVVAMGSGMTVKFFPLFFKNTLHLSPADVQLIYVGTPLAIAGFSGVSTWLSKSLGRIETILSLSVLGLACLVSLSLTYDRMKGVGRFGVIAIYISRTALMNCTYPLYESILMDNVPKTQRARWKSLESVAQFGWCGSAVVGGVLADRFDYAFTFLITAAVQGCGLSLLLLIRNVVPKEARLDKKTVDDVGGERELRHPRANGGAPADVSPQAKPDVEQEVSLDNREDVPLL